MKKLGFGCMRLPLTDGGQASIDRKALCGLFDLFLEKGYTYFDTAFFYHERESEKAVRDCLVKRHARDEFLLADKLPLSFLNTAADMEPIFSQQLVSCGVEYFDYYLLHNINPASYQKVCDFDVFGFLLQKKAEGKIRRLGFSFHGKPELLEQVLSEHPETEFVQLQVNYLDWDDPSIASRRCYEIARAHGKDVIVMEPCKGGELSVVPDQALRRMQEVRPGSTPSAWAFRFAAGLDGVILVLSGMNEQTQVLENTALFDSLPPLTEADRQVLSETVRLINSTAFIKCTACRYCEPVCPQNIPIPDCFSLYNRYMRTGLTRILGNYGFTVKNRGKVSGCITCRTCEEACPQGLKISELLAGIVGLFEAPENT